MSYHILNIDSTDSTIACKDRQLVCIEQDGTTRTVPLEDVGSIVVTSFKTTLTSNLLVEAARQGVAVIVCEGFQPVSIMLPVNRNTDTLLTRAHLAVHARQRGLLWRRTIDAKVRNQWLLCERWAPSHRGTAALKAMLPPLGSAAGAPPPGAERRLPFASASEPLAAPKGPAE